MAMKLDAKKQVRDVAIMFGALMASHGLVTYLPDISPAIMVVGGIAITTIAMDVK